MTRAAAARRGPATPVATQAQVDVWCVPLAALARDPATLPILSPDEHSRFARQAHEPELWAAARAALRRLTARALGVAPREVRFTTSERGRPALAAEHRSDLRFGVARAGALALVALRHGADVGVDLERVRANVDAEGIVAAAFPARERALWLASKRTNADFFAAWVRLEALAKATGLGIAGLTGTALPAGYTVRELPAIAGHTAAIASQGESWSVTCRTPAWSGSDAIAHWPRP